MPIPPAVIVVVVAIVLLAIWAVRSERRRAKERARLLSTMGFQPLQHPDPQATAALLALYRRDGSALRGRSLALRRVFQSDSSAGQLFVFDVVAPGSRRGSQIASGAVGVVRQGARLPTFEVCALAEQGGTASRLMLRLITKGLGHGQVVHFDDLPEFAQRFTVLAPDQAGEAAVRAYLTAAIRQKLLGARFFILAVGGDGFALQAGPPVAADRGNETAPLRRLIDDALLLAQALEPGGPASGDDIPGRG
jgi:hypothetical protein